MHQCPDRMGYMLRTKIMIYLGHKIKSTCISMLFT